MIPSYSQHKGAHYILIIFHGHPPPEFLKLLQVSTFPISQPVRLSIGYLLGTRRVRLGPTSNPTVITLESAKVLDGDRLSVPIMA
ncbi:hypothetical protein AFLA_002214 [Aspergillus flavus NRRL3357]|nr:hypothetical protein AFLA_002214 [Aspergillus flavus NRRL3357]